MSQMIQNCVIRNCTIDNDRKVIVVSAKSVAVVNGNMIAAQEQRGINLIRLKATT